ncbi:MAG TPA: hypothetical protein VHP37_15300 [Burkholderiales bacterium]|nr:hypothetical protein [Burkholderiales bacterium]
MNKCIAALSAIPLIYGAAFAQDVPDPAKAQPTTKLEAFSARTGVVVIKGYSSLGILIGTGRVTIDSREFRDASNPRNREYGITIAVKEVGRSERESTSYIDSDEIDSLIRGIDYIAKIDKSVTTMNEFEAQYRTRGDFAITTFSSSRGEEIRVAISSGRIGRTTAFFKLSDLRDLKDLIAKAKSQIDVARAAAK